MQFNLNRQQPLQSNYWETQLSQHPITVGDLQLFPQSNRVRFAATPILLRPMEFRMLHFFMSHAEQVHSRETLLEEVWDGCSVVGLRTVDVHIRRLRATLQPFGIDQWIQTVHCRGYLFSETI